MRLAAHWLSFQPAAPPADAAGPCVTATVAIPACAYRSRRTTHDNTKWGSVPWFDPDGSGGVFVAVVPEPVTLALVALGGLAALRRKARPR